MQYVIDGRAVTVTVAPDVLGAMLRDIHQHQKQSKRQLNHNTKILQEKLRKEKTCEVMA